MINTEKAFYGQQEDEKILYVVKPHIIATFIGLLKLYLVAFAALIMFFVLGGTVSLSGIFYTAGIIIFAVLMVFGTRIIQGFQDRSISYITDRRIVRFEPTTFFATNIRTLSWDESVKVKTFSPNILWKQMMVGTVVVHARTTVKTSDENVSHTAADDIELTDIFLYRDLGNYIDKILFTYKQMPKEVADIHPFVPKPKGQRY